MGSAYTPGLTVSGDITVNRLRRLPIKGDVLVKDGDKVKHDTIIARSMLPGPLQTIKISEKLSMEPKDAFEFLTVKVGDTIEKGQKIAESKGLLGRFMKTSVLSEYSGVVESTSQISGHLLLREPSTPVDVNAYIEGVVAEVIPAEGALIETRGAMVQGIFGVGGERNGVIRVVVDSPKDLLDADRIQDSDKGKILIGGSGITSAAIQKAVAVGALGLVAGGIKDSDLSKFLGYDIGVAITGQEAIPLTIVVTEGFGFLNIAQRTFELLKSLEGKSASINGATQIRAGVIRPEIIVPLEMGSQKAAKEGQALELKAGTPIRVIREPYFGQLGVVTDLPAQLMVVDSGTEVRVLKAKLEGGDGEVLVPRANVEILAT